MKAVEELDEQTHAVLHGQEPPAPQVYPHPIAFNVLGGAGNFADGDDHTDEERKMMFETRKILGDESIAINVTCARVPVRNCHSESVTLQTRDPLEVDEARDLLSRMPGLTMVDPYPTALGSAGRDDVFVGRLQRPVARARPVPVGGVGQPAQGRRDQRDPDRRGPARAEPGQGSSPSMIRSRPNR